MIKQISVPASLLACGVAMCVVSFAVAQRTLLQRLPWPSADRLVWLGAEAKRKEASGFGLVEYDRMVARATQLASSAPYMIASAAMRLPTGTERFAIARVGGTFFSVLGVGAMTGRTLTPRDDRTGAEAAVVLSEALWHRLHVDLGDPLGKVVELDGRPFRVVGALSKATAFPATADAWVAIEPTVGAAFRSTNVPFLHALGRVRAAGDIESLRAQLTSMRRSRDEGSTYGGRFSAERLQDYLMKDVRAAVLLLAGASATLLAIACLAVATILLAGRDRRERDLAIRYALGASVSRLWRSVLVEAGATAAVAATLGLGLSAAALAAARHWGAGALPELVSTHIDARISLAAVAVATFAAFSAVGLPMLAILGSDASDLLRRNGSTASASVRATVFRDILNAVSVGIALVLVMSFAVATDSLLRLVRIDTGFVTRNVVVGTVRLPMPIVTPTEAARLRTFMTEFSGAVADVTGSNVAISSDLPGKGNRSFSSVTSREAADPIQSGMTQVSGNYFSTVGIPLIAGRTFGRADQTGHPVAIIDQDLASGLYGIQLPIGQTVTIAAIGADAEIVGVVASVRQAGRLAERRPQIYIPIETLPFSSFAILERTMTPEVVTAAWKAAAQKADPDASIGGVSSLEEAVFGEMQTPQFYALVLMMFAGAAIIISGAAVYASVATLVSHRSREIAIRMALGAREAHVAALVLAGVFRMTLLGSVIGAMCALGAMRLLEANVGPLGRPTPLTILVSILALWCAAALASFRPVLRATRTSPTLALKE